MASVSPGKHLLLSAERIHTTQSYYRWYVLAVLWLVALLRFVDLQILAVLLEPIKAEFFEHIFLYKDKEKTISNPRKRVCEDENTNNSDKLIKGFVKMKIPTI